mmetsp:Transcript_47425/g.153936  ORF Transcript_47425/g.153936 Transcript_47425/m.153936 type:complete len:227 (-) Transcript_47425:637-1317(-)
MMSELGTDALDEVAFSRTVSAQTGSLGVSTMTSAKPRPGGAAGSPDEAVAMLMLSGRAVADKAPQLFDLAADMLVSTQLDNAERAVAMLKQSLQSPSPAPRRRSSRRATRTPPRPSRRASRSAARSTRCWAASRSSTPSEARSDRRRATGRPSSLGSSGCGLRSYRPTARSSTCPPTSSPSRRRPRTCRACSGGSPRRRRRAMAAGRGPRRACSCRRTRGCRCRRR